MTCRSATKAMAVIDHDFVTFGGGVSNLASQPQTDFDLRAWDEILKRF
jgi:hypothetical protein